MMRVGFFTGNKADPYFRNVVLLLHMDGANGSNTFIDSSINTKTIVAAGNTQISTANKKFGTGSGFFSNSYLNVTGSSDFEFGTGDYTIEFWMYPTSLPADGSILFTNFFYIVLQSSNLSLTSGGTYVIPGITANTWTYIAFSKTSNVLRTFKDGILIGSNAATLPQNITGDFQLGKWAALNAWQFPGYLDDFRITKGVGRYTTNFVVPSEPFPNS